VTTTTRRFEPSPDQLDETTADLNKAFRNLEWRMLRKSMFHTWGHCRFGEAAEALRNLAEICDADLSRTDQPQRSK
jgi:hypothetical protein